MPKKYEQILFNINKDGQIPPENFPLSNIATRCILEGRVLIEKTCFYAFLSKFGTFSHFEIFSKTSNFKKKASPKNIYMHPTSDLVKIDERKFSASKVHDFDDGGIDSCNWQK